MPIIKIIPMPGPSGNGDIFSVEASNQRTGTGEVLQFTDSTEQSIIIGPDPTEANPTAQRLVVAGKDGRTETTGEGGDVYLWAGRGGSAGGGGGDIKLDAGNGGGTTGSGGTVKMRGGYSQENTGGFVQVYAGDSNEGTGGYIDLRAGSNYVDTESYGGSVDIEAGGSGNAMGGGNINLRTYQAGKITLIGDGGEFLNDSSNPDNQIATIGDILSTTVPTAIKDTNGADLIVFEKGGTGVARIDAVQDDLALRSARDIILYPGDDGAGNVYINWGDATISPNATNRVATIADIEAGTTGDITFSGVQMIGAGTASSDTSGNGTIELVPDADLNTDQYLIIDPTGPNHIHIRGGGDIDESTADLIIGGERNKVAVSDPSKSVRITTAATTENTYVNANESSNADLIVPDTADIVVGDNIVMFGISYPVTYFSPDPNNTGFSIVNATGATFVAGDSYTFVREETYDHSWQFGSNGYLYGPAMGGLFVSGLINGESDLWIYSNDNIVLNSGDGGEFLNDPSLPGNQIAKIAYSREQYTTPATITAAIADMGKLLYANCGDGDMTYLIPDNGDVAFPIGSEIKFATGGDARWFINREDVEGPTDLIADGGNGYTAINDPYPYIIPIYSTATLMKVDTNRWILSGPRLTD